jgi:MSHA biogenesis protein MshL
MQDFLCLAIAGARVQYARIMLTMYVDVFIVKTLLLLLASFVMVACTHQSSVLPSEGHIDATLPLPIIHQQTPAPTIEAAIDNPTLDLTDITSAQTQRLPRQHTSNQHTSNQHTYSVVVNEVPVKEVLYALIRDTKMNADISPLIQGRVTINAINQTLPVILERLARQVDLTYQMLGDVLYIAPDQPELRLYQVDYVNMARDTKSFIGSATEISSTGQSASTGRDGQSSVVSTSGNGANNSSRTTVASESKNHLWESLISNIKDLLAEADKEVIVKRYGTSAPESEPAETITANQVKDNQRDKQRSEYKTLLAANVIANPETGVISVRATNKQHQKVQAFIDMVMQRANKQVLIEATIVEVQLSDSFQAGIDWRRLNNTSSNSGFVFGQSIGSKGINFNAATGALTAGEQNALGVQSNAGLVAGYINPLSATGNIAASITLLKKFGNTKVLSSPKLMVLNNQTAVLKVVNNIVYFTVQAQQSQNGVGGTVLSTVTTTPNTVPVGVVMSVTPQINQLNNVSINVRPTISSVVGFKQDPNPNLTIPSLIPEIQVREMESVLQINSGNTAVLGGLMQDEIQRNTDKIPGVSNLPIIGQAFIGQNEANRKTELVIFLRPTVVQNANLNDKALASFMRYLPAKQLEKSIEEANALMPDLSGDE